MINFKDAELLSVLPENLSRPETQALSASVKHGLQSLQRYARAAPLYAAIEELPEEVLNLLAVELRVQYYEPDAKRKVREGMIKQTVAWYLRGGTGSVVAEYLGTLFQGGTLQEWYTYGGTPFFFKAFVDLALSDVIAVGDGEKIIERIHTYKNVRSWLEALMFRIGADYEVPIRYDNAIRTQTQFHPRYNLAYLHLDGHWPLEGTRLLNGYDSENLLEFYPVKMRVKSEAVSNVQVEERLQMQGRFSVKVHMGLEMQLQAEVSKRIQTEERLRTCTGAAYAVEAASYMTKINQIDALWSLDGSRKLDGGRYVL